MYRSTFLRVAVITFALGAETAERMLAQDPMLATVDAGLLYGIGAKRHQVSENTAPTSQLIRIHLGNSGNGASRRKEDIRLFLERNDDLSANQPIRWRIATDTLWLCYGGVFSAGTDRLKVSDLDLFDSSDPMGEKMRQRYGRVYTEEELAEFFAWRFHDVQVRAEGLRGSPKLTGRGLTAREIYLKVCREMAFYDFLPTSPISGRLFLLEDNKCKIWSVLGEFKPSAVSKLREWQLTYSKDPIAVIDLGFTESFTVFANGDAYFFLTRSCRLYSAVKDADGKWKVEKLWSEASRPIHAVITDTATNRSYAFTQAKADKDGKKAKDVYFEFDTKLTSIEFDRSKLKSFQLDPPLDMLRSYTQVLIDARKIDPTPPKKKE